MGVVIFVMKTLLLIAVSFAFFFALAAGLGADLSASGGAHLVASQAAPGCEAVTFRNCIIMIF